MIILDFFRFLKLKAWIMFILLDSCCIYLPYGDILDNIYTTEVENDYLYHNVGWCCLLKCPRHVHNRLIHGVLRSLDKSFFFTIFGQVPKGTTNYNVGGTRNLLYIYLSVRRSHHIYRDGQEIPTLIQKNKDLDCWIL